MQSQRAGAKVSATVALTLILMLGLVRSAAAQNAGAADPPLNFGTNYFVTGDYVVAGAYGLTTNFTNVNGNSYAVGTINVPDLKNPFTNAVNTGNTGATSIPAGAQIVAAVLYWQTVEKIGVTPGGPGSGQIGFFRPVFPGGPQTGYILNGVDLQSQKTVSFSNGGCTGGSTGKAVRTYRADVRGYLPVDPATGNVLANGKYEVMLQSTSSTTPITLGATLFLIYRVVSSPDPMNPSFVPLNSIVIYDGVYAPGGTLLNMTQAVEGFYQADAHPVSRLTHIVGQGKSKKLESVSLNGIANNIARPPVALPSLYPGQPPFPGFYGTWDNPTWTFPYSGPNPPPANYPSNPLEENDDSAATMVAPNSSQQGCVSWGAVIVSTTVHDDDRDGILQVWKKNQGYTDAGTGKFVSLADPADPINTGLPRKDIFIQMDHVVDTKGDFTPDPLAVSLVTNAFLANNHNVHLHITDASKTTGIVGANIINEPAVMDGSASCNGGLCPYPNQPGITDWRDGFEFLENYPLNYTSEPTAQLNEADCEANSPPLVPIGPLNCVRRFPPQQRNSHHYVIIGDTLGAANWGLFGATLTDSKGTGAGVIVQFNNMVTFYTLRGHGLTPDALHPGAPNGRVTVKGAITNPKLNGTYLVKSITCQLNSDPTSPNFGQQDCSVSNKALGPYSFTIQLASAGTPPPTVCPPNTPGGSSCYTIRTDPRLSIASGQAGSGSGFSDVGGAGTVVTLGSWPLAYQTVSAKAGTLMHELGHTLTLLHGGGDNTNCKSNYQSVMNYMFQSKLMGPSGVVDFSSQQLSTLDETHLGPMTTTDPMIAFSTTRWYDTKQTLAFKSATITSFAINSNVVTFQAANTFTAGNMVQITGLTTGTYLNGQVLTVISAGLSSTQFEANFTHSVVPSTVDNGTAKTTTKVAIGSAATQHCDGTPLSIADPPTYGYKGGTNPVPNEIAIPWSAASLDANFEGNPPGSEPHPFNGYSDWVNTDPRQLGAAGNQFFGGPGGGFVPGGPGGGFVPGGPGGGFVPGGPGGGFVPGGPGGGFVPGGPGGGFVPGGPGASVELDATTAVSVTDPPSNLTASEDVSPRNIHLSWIPATSPQMDHFNIYRSSDNGASFSFFTSVPAPPLPPTGTPPPVMYTDVVTCNPSGYAYWVTGVLLNTTVTPPQQQESTPTNTVSTGQNGDRLTGCYTSPGAPTSVIAAPSVPANAVHGTIVSVTFTVLTDFNAANSPVNTTDNLALVTLVAIGPGLLANGCGTVGPTTLLNNGQLTPQSGALSTFPPSSGGLYTFNWDTDGFCAGSYTFKLTLDSTQTQTSSPLLISIDVNDQDTPHIDTLALTAGTVGVGYNNILTQHGGTGQLTWSFTGSLPTGITLGAGTGTLSGTTCVAMAGPYSFTAMVTDAKSNSGMQALTLQINKANTTAGVASNANANTSVFQQPVTFTVTVAQQPQSICTPGGTVTLLDGLNPIASNLMLNGNGNGMATATFSTSALSVGQHSITATYSGDSNFIGSNSATLVQTVNKASTAITGISVSPSPAFVGQAIMVSYTFAVMPLGAGTPIAPTGNITVMASDGSMCVVPAVQGSGACVLSPAPTTAGNRTFTVAYSGDSNFNNFLSGGADNYTVYELVFIAQPSSTVVGHTVTPAVQVAVQDGSNNTLTTFVGGITMAIKSGPATLSGTTTQTAVNGVATFNDLSINKVATADSLVASLSGGVAPAISSAFNITLALNYTQLAPSTNPGTRCCVAMAYDPISQSTLLFGGVLAPPSGSYTQQADTWQLSGSQWSQLSPGTSPPPRSGAAMVYDAAHNNIVLFGGTTGLSDLNDTWIWNGSTWTQANPSTSPPGRRFDSQGMAYDPNTQTVVMFGGIDVTNTVFFGDTWVWNGTNWVLQTPGSSPSARRTVLATDPTGNVMLFGGDNGLNSFADTWVWNGTTWVQQAPSSSPGARGLPNMAFNPIVGAVVLFAGGGGHNDVWSWDGTTWTQLTPAAPTPQRYAFGMDYDTAANAIFVFGGFTNNGPAINDTWAFTVAP